jgi:hypothetical protein
MEIEELESLARVWFGVLSEWVNYKDTIKDAPGKNTLSRRIVILVKQLEDMPTHRVVLLGMKIQELAGPGSDHEQVLIDILNTHERVLIDALNAADNLRHKST